MFLVPNGVEQMLLTSPKVVLAGKEQQNIEMIPRIDQSTWQRLCRETSFDSFMANRKYPEYYGGETTTPAAEDNSEASETDTSDESSSDEIESQKRKRQIYKWILRFLVYDKKTKKMT